MFGVFFIFCFFARFKALETVSIPVRGRRIYPAKFHNKLVAAPCITLHYTAKLYSWNWEGGAGGDERDPHQLHRRTQLQVIKT